MFKTGRVEGAQVSTGAFFSCNVRVDHSRIGSCGSVVFRNEGSVNIRVHTKSEAIVETRRNIKEVMLAASCLQRALPILPAEGSDDWQESVTCGNLAQCERSGRTDYRGD